MFGVMRNKKNVSKCLCVLTFINNPFRWRKRISTCETEWRDEVTDNALSLLSSLYISPSPPPPHPHNSCLTYTVYDIYAIEWSLVFMKYFSWIEQYIEAWQHTKAAIKHFTHSLYSFNVSPLIHPISHWAVSTVSTNASFQFSRAELKSRKWKNGILYCQS